MHAGLAKPETEFGEHRRCEPKRQLQPDAADVEELRSVCSHLWEHAQHLWGTQLPASGPKAQHVTRLLDGLPVEPPQPQADGAPRTTARWSPPGRPEHVSACLRHAGCKESQTNQCITFPKDARIPGRKCLTLASKANASRTLNSLLSEVRQRHKGTLKPFPSPGS